MAMSTIGNHSTFFTSMASTTATIVPIPGLDQYGTPPTALSLLLSSTSSEMEGMVDQLLELDGTGAMESDPAMLIHTLRPYCGQTHVSDFAKLLAESLAKKPVKECEWTRLLLTCIFGAVGLLGFVGNLLTVLVIFRTPSLHSHTNYFLASLAVSDLLLIFAGVSFDLFSLWRRYLNGWTAFSGFCEATSTSISWFTFCSILTIVGLTGERLVAICYPFSLRPYFYHGSMIWLICVFWIISFFPSLYIGLQFKTVVKDFCGRTHPNIFGNCDFVGWGGNQGEVEDHYTFEAQLLITFVFPVLFIVYCYVKILRTLNEATTNSHHLNATHGKGRADRGSNSQQSSQQQQQVLLFGWGHHLQQQEQLGAADSPLPSPFGAVAERRFFGATTTAGGSTRSKLSLTAPQPHQQQQLLRNSFGRNSTRSQQAQKTVMKMLVTITTLFFICYLPYHLERLIVKYTRGDCDQSRACVLLYPITGLLQYISATLNPIIYNVMSRRFRREFARILHKMCGREMREVEEYQYQHGGGRKNNTPLNMTPLNRLL